MTAKWYWAPAPPFLPTPVSLGVLILTGPPQEGDFNFDGSANAADYVLWRKSDGTQAGYNTWRDHFGATSGGSGAATGLSSSSDVAVPEPATVVLLVFAAAGWNVRQRRAA